MIIKKYNYPRILRIGKILSLFMVIFLFILTIIILIRTPVNSVGSKGEFIAAFFTLIMFSIFGIYFIYSYPIVWVDTNGIYIEFLMTRLRVEWSEIVDVRLGLGRVFRYWVVRTKKLTKFHKLYAFFATGKLSLPGFIIHSQMEGYKELMDEIQNHLMSRQDIIGAPV